MNTYVYIYIKINIAGRNGFLKRYACTSPVYQASKTIFSFFQEVFPFFNQIDQIFRQSLEASDTRHSHANADHASEAVSTQVGGDILVALGEPSPEALTWIWSLKTERL